MELVRPSRINEKVVVGFGRRWECVWATMGLCSVPCLGTVRSVKVGDTLQSAFTLDSNDIASVALTKTCLLHCDWITCVLSSTIKYGMCCKMCMIHAPHASPFSLLQPIANFGSRIVQANSFFPPAVPKWNGLVMWRLSSLLLASVWGRWSVSVPSGGLLSSFLK